MHFLCTNLPYPPVVITGACGMKQAGKSLYAYEMGHAIVKEEGGEILYIDTEEPTDFMFTVEIEKDEVTGQEAHRAWKDVFAEKYGVKPVIHFEYLPDTETIMDFFGIHGKVIITEGDEGHTKKDGTKTEEKGIKLEFKLIKVDVENSPFAKLLQEHDIRFIIVDSITVFNALTVGGRQNFNIRSQAEDMFFETLKTRVSKKVKETGKNIYIFTTNHLANNPTDPFTGKMDEKFLIEKGGKTIGHSHKVLFGFKKMMRPHGGRESVVMRYPNISEFSLVIPLLITDNGFTNVTKAELDKVKEQQKANT